MICMRGGTAGDGPKLIQVFKTKLLGFGDSRFPVQLFVLTDCTVLSRLSPRISLTLTHLVDAPPQPPSFETVAATRNSFDACPYQHCTLSTDISSVFLEACIDIPHPFALPSPNATSPTTLPFPSLDLHVVPDSGAFSTPLAWNRVSAVPTEAKTKAWLPRSQAHCGWPQNS